MRLSLALAVVALVATVGCSQIAMQPAVGTIDACSAEAALCRPIAEAAAHAIPGPPVVLDRFVIEDAGCDLTIDDQPLPPEAADATACYLVTAGGEARGERVKPHVYKGGKPISIQSVVWLSADGSLHARTTVTDTFAQ